MVRPGEKIPVVYAVQGEANTRSVELSLCCEGNVWNIPKNAMIAVRYRKQDQTRGYYDTLPDGTGACSFTGNVITMKLAPQMLSTAGSVLVQLELLEKDQVLSTFYFHVMVEPNMAAGVIDSETYVNWLTWIQNELDRYVDQVKESGEFLGGTMAGPIHMNGYAITGLNPPVAASDAVSKADALHLVKKAAPRNLLDNSDFLHFISQAGVGGFHGTQAYAGDRWILDSGTVAGNKNANGDGYSGITLNGTIRQIVPSPPETATVKIEMVSGTAAISYANGEVTITSAGGVIRGAMLFAGEYTTEALPEYQAKGYSTELAECQRYFHRYTVPAWSSLPIGKNEGTGILQFKTQFNIPPLRIEQPTVEVLCSGSM